MKVMTTQTNRNLLGYSIWEQLNWTWLHTFVLTQFLFQIMLLFPQIGLLRVPMRMAFFGLSLLFLILFPPKGERHPATVPAILVMSIMFLGLGFHPYTNSLASGLAQCFLYLSILAPLFWVSGLKITTKGFESLIVLIWFFQTVSAGLGVLQIYFPGQFQPALSANIQNSEWGVEIGSIILANGVKTFRPMGLTDTPGGAATAGFFALLFGVVIALKFRNPFLALLGAGSSAVGLFCILLSQVRSILVSLVICLLFFAVILVRTAQFSRLTAMASGVTALFVATFGWAIAVGGTSTLDRINTLFADKAENVYHQNRGYFLQDTIENLIPQYPFGAGLGRWGMINQYFGDPGNMDAQRMWVEIQWTGWVIDGGIPLTIAYVAAILIACYTAYKIATDCQLGDFSLWGGLILSYNIGALATCFNYPIFLSQDGIQFWLLNAALFATVSNYKSVNDKL
jgi:hypothetical protein